MATEAKVGKVILAVPSNQEYVDGIKSAPAFGIKDKLGYMFGDLGFNSLQVLVNTYLMIFFVNIVADALNAENCLDLCGRNRYSITRIVGNFAGNPTHEPRYFALHRANARLAGIIAGNGKQSFVGKLDMMRL